MNELGYTHLSAESDETFEIKAAKVVTSQVTPANVS